MCRHDHETRLLHDVIFLHIYVNLFHLVGIPHGEGKTLSRLVSLTDVFMQTTF